MSTARNDWGSCAIRMVRNYPARKAEYEALHILSIVSENSGMPKGGNASRTTENIALREMPPMKQREYEAVSRAVEITLLLPSGEERMELIRRESVMWCITFIFPIRLGSVGIHRSFGLWGSASDIQNNVTAQRLKYHLLLAP